MQTILGGGGVIGNEVAKSLTQYTKQIRIVSRNPVKVNDTDETFLPLMPEKQPLCWEILTMHLIRYGTYRQHRIR